MIGIISDIHGNYPALLAVMEELEKHNCEKIYCLGDICGYYCMINESISLLRDTNTICIRGNHDSYLLGEQKCPRSHTANVCIQYQQNMIEHKNYKWVQELPDMILTDEFCAVHGGWDDYIDEYIERFDFNDNVLRQYPVNLFASGHTHKQILQKNGDKTYFNPGAVGQPRDYQPTAGFALIEEGKVFLRRVEYDMDRIAFAMKQAGFEEKYYLNLYYGTRIGENRPA